MGRLLDNTAVWETFAVYYTSSDTDLDSFKRNKAEPDVRPPGAAIPSAKSI